MTATFAPINHVLSTLSLHEHGGAPAAWSCTVERQVRHAVIRYPRGVMPRTLQAGRALDEALHLAGFRTRGDHDDLPGRWREIHAPRPGRRAS